MAAPVRAAPTRVEVAPGQPAIPASFAAARFTLTPLGRIILDDTRRREAARRERQGEDPCPICGQPVADDQAAAEIGGRWLHDGLNGPECRAEFEAWATEGDDAREARERYLAELDEDSITRGRR